MKTNSRIRCLTICFGAVLAVACASTTVNKILSDPSQYRDRDVTVSGEVTESVSIANRGVYKVDDGTGQLWVVSTEGVPRKGAKVTVKGRIREAFDLGSLGERIELPAGLQSGLVLMESSHTARE